MKNKKVSVEVVETLKKIPNEKRPFFIGVLKWNNGSPKVNIRRMYFDKDGSPKFGKGISLDDEEVIIVYRALKEYIEKNDL